MDIDSIIDRVRSAILLHAGPYSEIYILYIS